MKYYAICNETNEHLLNSDGDRIVLSDITKKSYDMLKEEFSLLGNVRLEPVSQYEDVPIYHWYIANKRIEGKYRVFWVNGRQYVGFTEEPSYEDIEKYDLRFSGIGDITTVGS